MHFYLFFVAGYYIYYEASGGKTGDQAQIESKTISTGTKELTFYYHMYGSRMGSLRAFVKTASGTFIIWQKSGNQGNQWKKATVYYSPTTSYTVRIFYLLYLLSVSNFKVHFLDRLLISFCPTLARIKQFLSKTSFSTASLPPPNKLLLCTPLYTYACKCEMYSLFSNVICSSVSLVH